MESPSGSYQIFQGRHCAAEHFYTPSWSWRNNKDTPIAGDTHWLLPSGRIHPPLLCTRQRSSRPCFPSLAWTPYRYPIGCCTSHAPPEEQAHLYTEVRFMPDRKDPGEGPGCHLETDQVSPELGAMFSALLPPPMTDCAPICH